MAIDFSFNGNSQYQDVFKRLTKPWFQPRKLKCPINGIKPIAPEIIKSQYSAVNKTWLQPRMESSFNRISRRSRYINSRIRRGVRVVKLYSVPVFNSFTVLKQYTCKPSPEPPTPRKHRRSKKTTITIKQMRRNRVKFSSEVEYLKRKGLPYPLHGTTPDLTDHSKLLYKPVSDYIKKTIIDTIPGFTTIIAMSTTSAVVGAAYSIYGLATCDSAAAYATHAATLGFHLATATMNLTTIEEFRSVKARLSKALSPKVLLPLVQDLVKREENDWDKSIEWFTDGFDTDSGLQDPSPYETAEEFDQQKAIAEWFAKRDTIPVKTNQLNINDLSDHTMDTIKWVKLGAIALYSIVTTALMARGSDIRYINSVFTLKDNIKRASADVSELTAFIMTDILSIDVTGVEGMVQLLSSLQDRANAFHLKSAVDVCKAGTHYVLRDLIQEITAALSKQTINNDRLSSARTLLGTTLAHLNTLMLDVWQRKKTNEAAVDPYVVQLIGKPGVGKTRFARYISDVINQELYNDLNAGLYQVNLSRQNFFFTRYTGQKIAFFDEFLAQRADDPLVGMFNDIFSGAFFNLEGAAIEEKFQPREFELAILSSNLGRCSLRNTRHNMDVAAERALFSRITSIEVCDPLVLDERRDLNHRTANYSHLTLYPVTYVQQGEDYRKVRANNPISVRTLIDSIKDRIRQAQANVPLPGAPQPPCERPGDEVPPESEEDDENDQAFHFIQRGARGRRGQPRNRDILPDPAVIRRLAAEQIAAGVAQRQNPQPVIIQNFQAMASNPYIVHLNGVPHSNKTLFAETTLKHMAATYNLPFINVQSFTENPSENAMYLVDDMIELGINSNAREYMKWLSQVPTTSIVVVCSNLQIEVQPPPTTNRILKYVPYLNHYVPLQCSLKIPSTNGFTGVARRLAMSGLISSGYKTGYDGHQATFTNPHCGTLVIIGSDRTKKVWDGASLTPTSDTQLLASIENSYHSHLTNSGNRVELFVDTITATTADIIVLAPSLQDLAAMLKDQYTVISKYVSPTPPKGNFIGHGVWLTPRTINTSISGGAGYWTYSGPLTTEDEAIDLCRDYVTRMRTLGNDFSCLVKVGSMSCYAEGATIHIARRSAEIVDIVDAQTTPPVLQFNIMDNGLHTAIHVMQTEVDAIERGAWQLSYLHGLPLSYKTIIREALMHDARCTKFTHEGLAARRAHLTAAWRAHTLKSMKEFISNHKWALAIGFSATVVAAVYMFSGKKKEPQTDCEEAPKNSATYELAEMEKAGDAQGKSLSEVVRLFNKEPSLALYNQRPEGNMHDYHPVFILYPKLVQHLGEEFDVWFRFENGRMKAYPMEMTPDLENHIKRCSDQEYQQWLESLGPDDQVMKRFQATNKGAFDYLNLRNRGKVLRSEYMKYAMDFSLKPIDISATNKPRGYKPETKASKAPRNRQGHKPKGKYALETAQLDTQDDYRGGYEQGGSVHYDLVDNMIAPLNVTRMDATAAVSNAAQVQVQSSGGACMGLHLREGFILTVAHALRNDKTVRISTNEAEYSGRVLYFDETTDIGLVHVGGHFPLPWTISRFTKARTEVIYASALMNRKVPLLIPGFATLRESVDFERSYGPTSRKWNYYLEAKKDNFRDGDCGSVLLTDSGDICGIYSGYSYGLGQALYCALTLEIVETLLSSFSNLVPSAPHDLQDNTKNPHQLEPHIPTMAERRAQENAEPWDAHGFEVDPWTRGQISSSPSKFDHNLPNVGTWKRYLPLKMTTDHWHRTCIGRDEVALKEPLNLNPDNLKRLGVPESGGEFGLRLHLAQKFVRDRKAPNLDYLKELAEAAAEAHFTGIECSPMSFHEVVFGLKPSHRYYGHFERAPFDTSAGEYYRARYNILKKSDFFELNEDGSPRKDSTGNIAIRPTSLTAWQDLQDRVSHIIELAKEGKTLMTIHKANVKDELLKPAKAQSANGRLFYSCDWALNIWLNMTYGGVFARMRQMHRTSNWKIGSNLETEYHDILTALTTIDPSQTLCVDAANWDISMDPKAIQAAQHFLDTCLKLGGKMSQSGITNRGKAAAKYRSHSFILTDDTVVSMDGIMTSGIAGTTEVNCIIHMLVYMHFLQRTHPSRSAEDCAVIFQKEMMLIDYGDDGQLSVGEALKARIGGPEDPYPVVAQLVSSAYRDFGISVTNDAKTGPPAFTPYYESSFCSRFPRYYDGTWLPALKPASIQSLYLWAKNDSVADLATRANNALLYSTAWGRKPYNALREKVMSAPQEIRAQDAWKRAFGGAGAPETWTTVSGFLKDLMRGRTEATFSQFCASRSAFVGSFNSLQSIDNRQPTLENHCLPVLTDHMKKTESNTKMASIFASDQTAVLKAKLVVINEQLNDHLYFLKGVHQNLARGVSPKADTPQAINEVVKDVERLLNEFKEDFQDHIAISGFYTALQEAVRLIAYAEQVEVYTDYFTPLWNRATTALGFACDLMEDSPLTKYMNRQDTLDSPPMDYLFVRVPTIVDKNEPPKKSSLPDLTDHMDPSAAAPPTKTAAPVMSTGPSEVVDTTMPIQQSLIQASIVPETGVTSFQDSATSMNLQQALIPSMANYTGDTRDIKTLAHLWGSITITPYKLSSTQKANELIFAIPYSIDSLHDDARDWIRQHRNWDGDIKVKVIVTSNALNQGRLMFAVMYMSDVYDRDATGKLTPKQSVNRREIERHSPVKLDVNNVGGQLEFLLVDNRDTSFYRKTTDAPDKYFETELVLVCIIDTEISANAKDTDLVLPVQVSTQWIGQCFVPMPRTVAATAGTFQSVATRIGDLVDCGRPIILNSDADFNSKTTPAPPASPRGAGYPYVMHPAQSDYVVENGHFCKKPETNDYWGLWVSHDAAGNLMTLGDPTTGMPFTDLKRCITGRNDSNTIRFFRVWKGALANVTFYDNPAPSAGPKSISGDYWYIIAETDFGIVEAFYFRAPAGGTLDGNSIIAKFFIPNTAAFRSTQILGGNSPSVLPTQGFVPIRFSSDGWYNADSNTAGLPSIPLELEEWILRDIFLKLGSNVSFNIVDTKGWTVTTVCFIDGAFYYTADEWPRTCPIDMRTCRINSVSKLSPNTYPPSVPLPSKRQYLAPHGAAEPGTATSLALTRFGPMTPIKEPIDYTAHMMALGAALTAQAQQAERWGMKVFDRRTAEKMQANQIDATAALQESSQANQAEMQNDRQIQETQMAYLNAQLDRQMEALRYANRVDFYNMTSANVGNASAAQRTYTASASDGMVNGVVPPPPTTSSSTGKSQSKSTQTTAPKIKQKTNSTTQTHTAAKQTGTQTQRYAANPSGSSTERGSEYTTYIPTYQFGNTTTSTQS
jgi:hypothetical protein